MNAAAELVRGLGAGPMFVHADLLRSGLAAEPGASRAELLSRHMAALLEAAPSGVIWMPAFSYSYLGTRRFDPDTDRSEVGPLSEHFRTEWAAWRTAVPVFSVAGLGPRPPRVPRTELDPFDADSDFAELARRDGVVLFYGAPFATATLLHRAERASGPAYRYDKRFPGVMVGPSGGQDVVLLYHVRPRGRHLDYAWARLLREATDAGVCRSRESGLARLVAASARALLSYWIDCLAADPLYLLDAESRAWVEPMLERFGRRFQLEDFETATA